MTKYIAFALITLSATLMIMDILQYFGFTKLRYRFGVSPRLSEWSFGFQLGGSTDPTKPALTIRLLLMWVLFSFDYYFIDRKKRASREQR